MKRLTMKFLSIQVDMPDNAEPAKFAQEAIELINLSLQREPYDLAAQVFDNGNPVIEVEPLDEGEEPEPTEAEEPMRFCNTYYCARCDARWTDVWSCACNDKCPKCNKEIEPESSEEITPTEAPKKK